MTIETTKLTQSVFAPPATFAELFEQSNASAAGYSAVSLWLTCPERSRLTSKGVRRRPFDYDDHGEKKLSDLAFGVLMHYLRAVRITQGPDMAEATLRLWEKEVPQASFLKALLLLRTYESLYPLAQDTFRYVGVETEVVTNINRGLAGENAPPIMRTVRYDSVIYVPGVGGAPDELFSFEAKTMSRSGHGSVLPYTPQAMTQVALWNTNPYLVKQYGLMRGVIYDCLVKTTTPTVDRLGPYYIGTPQQKLALQYLAYADPTPETGGVVFMKDAQGRYPKMLHACWGRWRACEFIGLCHEGSFGDYETKDGRVYDGE